MHTHMYIRVCVCMNFFNWFRLWCWQETMLFSLPMCVNRVQGYWEPSFGFQQPPQGLWTMGTDSPGPPNRHVGAEIFPRCLFLPGLPGADARFCGSNLPLLDTCHPPQQVRASWESYCFYFLVFLLCPKNMAALLALPCKSVLVSSTFKKASFSLSDLHPVLGMR